MGISVLLKKMDIESTFYLVTAVVIQPSQKRTWHNHIVKIAAEVTNYLAIYVTLSRG